MLRLQKASDAGHQCSQQIIQLEFLEEEGKPLAQRDLSDAGVLISLTSALSREGRVAGRVLFYRGKKPFL